MQMLNNPQSGLLHPLVSIRLQKNITDYKIYIDLMEKSKKDGSLLTFTLANDDPSVIKSINK
jgi:hypothetical protein